MPAGPLLGCCYRPECKICHLPCTYYATPRRCFISTVQCAGLVLAAALLALSCGDMHYTARYFHERMETILGAVLGLLAFQIPVAWWLLYGFTVPYARR